ncbi:DUF2461 domain-containing protein [Candidatus Enterococcus ferrettii]|uniref:TIGR02453 family protein n=1 Tax=Candidatus Enterococcus ferrettii TaxID=2815324 RepID=A0ABV0ETY1_9ENTE|nr:DUF2461 domain-containing protein [Enterococcus sp. 665A]MBO1339279.1 DUF2461 domain-containing protein [Enterococcus sp. 665A]
MNLDRTLEFLTALEANNSFEWMKEHKKDYQIAKNEFLKFVQELLLLIAEFDPPIGNLEPKRLVYRLNRDIRFSHDKTPYHPAFRAHLSIAERKPIPAGYYICIKPGQSFLGGGVFAPQFSQATELIREHLVSYPEEFQQIITRKAFIETFKVEGLKLKNVPRGYDKDHPLAEYLKHKSWNIEYKISDQELLTEASEYVVEKFKLMLPLNGFLNQGLVDFRMPERGK